MTTQDKLKLAKSLLDSIPSQERLEFLKKEIPGAVETKMQMLERLAEMKADTKLMKKFQIEPKPKRKRRKKAL
ncbi:hypothetical protein D1Z97_03095 [Riemerella anatipestifer]|uniref:hypothetical protein n=1 Tax=Riemerella anatipestifer TaxID=34085 RepID=UPI00129D35F6|nr:hypothetical protein [Riemerella anatipestifer]MRN00194.1 hypothetical protein [Riemerella anatipestifer]MRN02078.1 hypothetical protein [Riemerella anatipestifer]